MTITDQDRLTRDQVAAPVRPPLDGARTGYAPPALEVLGTLEKLATIDGSAPRAMGASI